MVELSINLKYRDIGTKSVNRYTDRETVSRIATFGKSQPYSEGSPTKRSRLSACGGGPYSKKKFAQTMRILSKGATYVLRWRSMSIPGNRPSGVACFPIQQPCVPPYASPLVCTYRTRHSQGRRVCCAHVIAVFVCRALASMGSLLSHHVCH